MEREHIPSGVSRLTGQSQMNTLTVFQIVSFKWDCEKARGKLGKNSTENRAQILKLMTE